MADSKELANKARTTLAQALQALQAAQDEQMMEVAEPIAATMSVLHRIEKGESVDGPTVQQALDNVRTALDTLQKVETQDDAVDSAMEAVAGSLSKLFTLHRTVTAKPTTASAVPRAPAAQAPPAQAPSAEPMAMGGTHLMPPQQQPQPQQQQAYFPPATQPQAAPPQADMGFAPTMEAAVQPHGQPQHTEAIPAPPMHIGHQVPFGAPGAATQPEAQGAVYPGDHHVPGMTDAPPPPTGSPYVDVELGAHSGSNFYKGLSGNDVIDHGGIFVATYQIPKIGSPVALRMLLPGDLEFQADALVQWVRETRSGDSEPGFGAKFTRITPEGRQLVYRYVRNREPIFYDDF
jgi:hypothetical protein